jgi:hypothetical protein
VRHHELQRVRRFVATSLVATSLVAAALIAAALAFGVRSLVWAHDV